MWGDGELADSESEEDGNCSVIGCRLAADGNGDSPGRDMADVLDEAEDAGIQGIGKGCNQLDGV